MDIFLFLVSLVSPYLNFRVPIFSVLAKNVNSVSGRDKLRKLTSTLCKSALCTVNYDLYALVFYLYVGNEVFLPVRAWQSFLIKNLFSLLLAGIKSTRCQGNHNFVLYLEHKNQNFTFKSEINILFTDLRCHWGKNSYSFFLQYDYLNIFSLSVLTS